MLNTVFRTCRSTIHPRFRHQTQKYFNRNQLNRLVHTTGIGFCKILDQIKGSPKGTYEFPESHANFETSTAEWEFVERLIPPKHIPEPKHPSGTVTPSGWVAPSAKPGDHPYFVVRNSSHLLRIYKDVDMINLSVKTRLKGIEGDVFALGKELEDHLLKLSGRRHVSVRVHEPHGVLTIKGDYSQEIREFMVKKGF